MNGSTIITRADLVRLLEITTQEIADGASWEGRIAYTCMDERCKPDEFIVRAFVRTGNDEGQGGSILVSGEVEAGQ